MAERSLVIKVTAGKDDPERCNQAFTVAAAAVASGVRVSLWLTGESAWFGLPGRAEDFSLPHAAPLADLLAGVLAAGTVTVCTQCAARRDIEPDDLIPGIRIAGAPTFVAEIMADGAQALVYLRRPGRSGTHESGTVMARAIRVPHPSVGVRRAHFRAHFGRPGTRWAGELQRGM